jgi:hypothetical protein
MMVVGFYFIALVKIYILVAFVPALSIWLLVSYSKKIRSWGLRWTLNTLTISMCGGGLIFLSQNFAEELGKYSLDKIANTAKVTKGYINSVSEEEGGSAYDLGEFEPTLSGMLTKFPQAVVVTLFRPFLWEAKKPIMLLSALESLAFALLFINVFFRRGIKMILRKTLNDPNLLFFLIYSLLFAFAVGVSTGNFGTLSRYKIPCVPFFAAFLLILYYQQKTKAFSQKVITEDERKPVYHLT